MEVRDIKLMYMQEEPYNYIVITLTLPREDVDKMEKTLNSKGLDAFMKMIPTNLIGSINTDNSMRDEHLKSNDIFCADKLPKITFKSTSLKKKSGNQYQLIGDLTIRDITKTVVFDVKYGGTAIDAYGNTKAGFRVSGKINRMDYGLKWNVLTEAGGATVGSEVSLTGNLEFVLAK